MKPTRRRLWLLLVALGVVSAVGIVTTMVRNVPAQPVLDTYVAPDGTKLREPLDTLIAGRGWEFRPYARTPGTYCVQLRSYEGGSGGYTCGDRVFSDMPWFIVYQGQGAVGGILSSDVSRMSMSWPGHETEVEIITCPCPNLDDTVDVFATAVPTLRSRQRFVLTTYDDQGRVWSTLALKPHAWAPGTPSSSERSPALIAPV